MSEANVELVLRGVEAFNRRDWDAAMEFFDPDVEWHDPPQLPGASVHRGLEQVLGFFHAMEETIDGFAVQPERCFAVGDRVVALLRSGGRGRASGVEISRQIAQIFTVRDGRITAVVGYDDQVAALEAVGQAPPGGNLDVVRQQFEAIERGGLDAAAEFWHPDIEWRAVEGAIDDVGVFSGRGAMRRYYGDWTETVDEMRVDIDRVVHDAGETLVVVLRTSGHARGSSIPVQGRYAVVYRIRDGLIVSGREYETPEQAMQSLRSSQPAD